MPRRSSSASSEPKSPPAPSPRGSVQRLQRVLAAAGYGSRRSCEELILEGRVEVDGQTVEQLGTQVDPATAQIYVDGTLLRPERRVYFVLNKPTGVVTTNRDPQGRTRVIDLVQERERLFPVGRLDRSSEGLLLLTNDGDLAQQLAHPRYGIQKTYQVTVAGQLPAEALQAMRRGIYLAEARVRVEGARIRNVRSRATELEIILREGKNREIRRILARLGHKVLSLRRVAIGPLRLGDLPPGAYRPLSRDELRRLREAIRTEEKRAAERPRNAAKKPGAKKPGLKKPGGKKPGAKKPAAMKSAGVPKKLPGRSAPKVPLRLEESTRVGTIIGDESSGPGQTAARNPAAGAKRKSASPKKSGPPRKAAKRAGGKGKPGSAGRGRPPRGGRP